MRVAVIGAGVSGIGMAKRLKDAGYDFTVYEKAERVGGTWRENHYPGLECDVPALMYTYTFDRKIDWPRLLAPGAQIQEYLEGVPVRHGLTGHIRFGTQITDAEWLGDRWRLRSDAGEEGEFDAIVQATGFLHNPRFPDIPGLDSFEGVCMHSAQWRDEERVDGLRVGVIGSGSSGVQIVSALAGRAASVTSFQRSPQWIFPLPNPRVPQWFLRLMRRSPRVVSTAISAIEAAGEWFVGGAAIENGRRRKVFKWGCRKNLARIRDPRLRAQLTPDVEPLCKRPIMSASFYGAVQRDDVNVVTEGISKIRATGVLTEDGVLHELDVLVLATGFRSHDYMRPMRVAGDGVELGDVWKECPVNYRTVMVPGFPNMFMVMGPHSPLVHLSIHGSVEMQADYVVKALEAVAGSDATALSPKPEAASEWIAQIEQGVDGTVWASGCQSWYLADNGVPVLWPFSGERWHATLAEPELEDYEFVLRE